MATPTQRRKTLHVKIEPETLERMDRLIERNQRGPLLREILDVGLNSLERALGVSNG